MKYRITTWLAAALMLSSLHATAASLSDIQVSNGDQQARITPVSYTHLTLPTKLL